MWCLRLQICQNPEHIQFLNICVPITSNYEIPYLYELAPIAISNDGNAYGLCYLFIKIVWTLECLSSRENILLFLYTYIQIHAGAWSMHTTYRQYNIINFECSIKTYVGLTFSPVFILLICNVFNKIFIHNIFSASANHCQLKGEKTIYCLYLCI